MSQDPSTSDDDAVPMLLHVVDVIDCIAGNTPNAEGRPISILTLAHLGELEQPLCISYEDSKRLVTLLLQSLADHGNDFAIRLMEEHFASGFEADEEDPDSDDGDDEEGESWKNQNP